MNCGTRYRFKKLTPQSPSEATRYEAYTTDGVLLGTVTRMDMGYWLYQTPNGPSLTGAESRYEAAWILDETRKRS